MILWVRHHLNIVFGEKGWEVMKQGGEGDGKRDRSRRRQGRNREVAWQDKEGGPSAAVIFLRTDS